MDNPTGHDQPGDDQPGHDQHVVEELAEAFTDPDDVAAARELAEAERALARGGATPRQERGIAATRGIRRVEERVGSWRAATTDAAPRDA